MLHALRPGHLAHVNQAFNSLLEFDERSVVGHADDASAHVSAYRITMLGIEPRIRRELLESQRHALLFLVVLENFYLDLATNIHEVLGMWEPSPEHAVMCSRPSRPPRSTKAPYSVRFLTTPVST